MAADIDSIESTSQRVASLRTILREYLLALETGDVVVAQMLERCTLGPRVGPSVMTIPLARVPGKGS